MRSNSLVSVDSSAPFRLFEFSEAKQWPFFGDLTLKLMLNDWINEMSKQKQLLFLSETMQLFSYSRSDVWLFLFLPIFPPLLTKRAPCIEFSLLKFCTTRVKISRIFCESDEYLCPLTVNTMWHGRRIMKQTWSAPAPHLPPKKNMFNVLSSRKLEFSATHWNFSVEWSNYSVKDI